MSDFPHHPWLQRQTRPWRVTDELEGTWYRVRGDDGLLVSAVLTRSNADLVAAAPEMLEALKVATTDNWDPMLMSANDIRSIMLAAIAKAEGRDD